MNWVNTLGWGLWVAGALLFDQSPEAGRALLWVGTGVVAGDILCTVRDLLRKRGCK